LQKTTTGRAMMPASAGNQQQQLDSNNSINNRNSDIPAASGMQATARKLTGRPQIITNNECKCQEIRTKGKKLAKIALKCENGR
jgi:hypothetical protein